MITNDILLLDGECGLCNRMAVFLYPRLNIKENLNFVTNQSEEGQEIIKTFSINQQEADTVYLIRNEKSYIRSAAGIRCLLYMKWHYKIWYPFLWIIPLPFRDLIYKIISKNRHKIFSKPDICMIPEQKK
jgi:predicted DCC family thiol-disulfide oxidoreductase YuxK|tara:strand:+ start:4017 stop:4406 length:390 start_codon:yes stop_codon:yes gene_type:complete